MPTEGQELVSRKESRDLEQFNPLMDLWVAGMWKWFKGQSPGGDSRDNLPTKVTRSSLVSSQFAPVFVCLVASLLIIPKAWPLQFQSFQINIEADST